jgi:hypothetical protein
MDRINAIGRYGTKLVLCSLLVACSKEKQILGEWRSTEPMVVTLQVSKSDPVIEGYHYGFSYTSDGGTYSGSGILFWRVGKGRQGTTLYLTPGGSLLGVRQMAATALPHKILELSSDRLVIEWDTRRSAQDNGTAIYTFLRVGSKAEREAEAERAANAQREAENQRLIEERARKEAPDKLRLLLTELPELNGRGTNVGAFTLRVKSYDPQTGSVAGEIDFNWGGRSGTTYDPPLAASRDGHSSRATGQVVGDSLYLKAEWTEKNFFDRVTTGLVEFRLKYDGLSPSLTGRWTWGDNASDMGAVSFPLK